MKEEWKLIEDFPNYQVSNLGRVRSKNPHFLSKKYRILKPWKTGTGYYEVQFCDGTKRRRCSTLGRLVAKAFVDNPQQKAEVNHKNGQKLDNHYLNLEWVTPSENILHAYRKGLIPFKGGEKCHLSKLKEQQVLEIRRIAEENPTYGFKAIGDMFNVSGACISKIIRRQRWTQI